MARDVDASDLMPVSRERGPHGQLEQIDLRQRIRAGARGAAADAPRGRGAARPAGVLVSGNRRPAAPARRHRQVAHQPRPARARPPAASSRSRVDRRPSRPPAEEPNERHDLSHRQCRRACASNEPRLTYPILSDFASDGDQPHRRRRETTRRGLSTVGYVDSATIGCLMDLYRQATAAGGTLKLAGRAEAGRDDVDDDRRAQLSRGPRRRGLGPREFRRLAMRTITTISGTQYRARRRRARRHRDHLARPGAAAGARLRLRGRRARIQHVVAQLTDDELRTYLKESLFMSFNRFENDRMMKIVRPGRTGRRT